MKKFDPKWLPYFGALVQAGLFSIAGSRYFESFGWLIGLGVGAVVNASLAVASSRVSDVAQKRKLLAYLALVGMFLLSPITITLSLFMPASVFTAIAWAMSPDLAIVLAGAIAGKSLVASEQVDKKLPKPAGKKKQEPKILARKHVKDAELLAYLQANPGASQQSVGQYFGITRQAVGPRIKKLYAMKPATEEAVKA
jgi:hypothetical protein